MVTSITKFVSGKIIAWLSLLLAFLTLIAATLVVPEVREFWGLDSSPSAPPSSATKSQPEPEQPPITPEFHEMGVFVVNDNNQMNWELSNRMVSILKSKEPDVITSTLLTEKTVVVNQLFNRLLNGDTHEIKRLNLSKRFNQIVLGKKSVQFTDNPELENTITAQVSLQIHVITLPAGIIANSFTITAPGIGFSQAVSEANAIEEIFNQLVNKL